MKDNSQLVYISLDDSGKLNKNEKYLVYAGLYFTNQKELEKFKVKYKRIRTEISRKDKYNGVDELKGYTLDKKDRIRFLKFINKYNILGLIVENSKIEKEEILVSKKAKGRYRDYIIKLLVKELFINLVANKVINPYKPVKLIINMDQESSKTNGKYSLDEGIIEELTKGIVNFNYSFRTAPILFSDFDIKLYSQNSKHSIIIQASDIIANNIWRNLMENNDNYKIDIIKVFP